MSHLSTISIEFTKPAKFGDILSILLAFGWTLNDHGQICILPVGNADISDWVFMEYDQAKAWQIIREKVDKDEDVGIVITWQDTLIGCAVTLKPGENIRFALNVHRQELPDCGHFTDVSWYLSKLIPALSYLHTISSISWNEFI